MGAMKDLEITQTDENYLFHAAMAFVQTIAERTYMDISLSKTALDIILGQVFGPYITNFQLNMLYNEYTWECLYDRDEDRSFGFNLQ